jgi:hypothetical protein
VPPRAPSLALRALLACLAALGAGSTLGCAYARERAADLADVFTLEVGAGYGLHADVKATDLLHVGAGYAHLRKAGFRGRDLVWARDREVGLPVSAILAVGAWRDGGYDRLGHLHVNLGDLLAYDDPWRRADLEVGVTAGIVSLRIGLSPGHLVDLLAGIVGLDPAGDDRGVPFEDPAAPGAEWLAGDLHAHCEPPDVRGHAPLTPAEAVDLARGAGLDFVALTPHFWTSDASDDPEMRDYAARATALCARADEEAPRGDGPVVLPGFEVTGGWRRRGDPFPGHAALLFRRPEDAFRFPAAPLRGGEYALEALARVPPRDRLIAPAHPLARRVNIPFLPDWASNWRSLDGSVPDYDGLEAWTLLHRLGELAIGRARDETQTGDVLRALDARIARTRRRFTLTGGSDNHRDIVLPCVWALTSARTRDGVMDAIVEGRVCVGGDEAGSLEARSDREPSWRPIGADIAAEAWVEVRWRGSGTLVWDGEARGAGRGDGATPLRVQVGSGEFHFLRLEAGPGTRSRSGWIYVNRGAGGGGG